jgi:xanthine dehydrogenase accessory factor
MNGGPAPAAPGPDAQHDGRDPDAALAAAWLASGEPVMRVQVLSARGSVPREAGTCMLVRAGAVQGTIGGGHLEWQAIRLARERLATGERAAWDWPVALGPSLGQCCGGALTLRFQALDPAAVATWGRRPPRFRLHLFGAGHVGRALVTLLGQLPCEVRWVDSREQAFPPGPWPPPIEPVWSDPPQAEVAAGRPGDAWLVMTHSHDLDLALVAAILARGDAGWVGLIGSATKRARFEARLRERGLPAAQIEALVCPVGLAGLAGKEPGVIAVSVAAQLLFSHIDS